MILLIGSKYDLTSILVTQWLHRLKSNFIKINTEEFSLLNHFKISNTEQKIKINNIDFELLSSVWHRRGRLRHIPLELNNLGDLSKYLKKEEDSLIKTIELSLKKSTLYIGSYLKEIENYKLYNLQAAKDSGFLIPNTLITNSKEELQNFYNETKGELISKDIRYSVNIVDGNNYIGSCGTFILKEKDINLLDNDFAPILVQEYIEKEFELRVFFFKKKIFPMAIFSQNDAKTKVDFRNYNEEKPNRCVPFDLPIKLQDKILRFSQAIDLNSGSIDLIYSKEKEYVFLEVNPMGQLDWVSKNCNYNIEKEIATILNNYDKECE